MSVKVNNKNVEHPKHYNIPGRKECIEEMREMFGNEIVYTFCITNAYKYLYRAGMKDGNSKEQDIAKAEYYYKYARDLYDTSDFILSVTMDKMTKMIRKMLNK